MQNIILIPGFPGNRFLVKDLMSYFSEFGKVYTVDLPGFVPDITPLKNPSIENFSRYVEEYIKGLGLKNYIPNRVLYHGTPV